MWRRLLPGSAGVPLPPALPLSQARRIVVLEEGATPSGDYILHPWLATQGVPVLRLDVRLPPRTGQLEVGDFVVVLRYLHAAWKRAIERQRADLSGLAWFLDDDLLDPAALAELAAPYARKIRTLATDHQRWAERMGAQWWMSTEALGRKYAALSPRVLPLAPPPGLWTPQPGVKIVYHGTASHSREIEWLRKVVAEVQAARRDTHFELFGDLSVNRLYRDLPRVAVLHPMRWDNYLAYSASHPADIGLAPLLPGHFNAGRGPVKFFDHARMGAIGLYSDLPPYAGHVRDGVDGVLLPGSPAAWVEAITRWAGDSAGRRAMSAAARQRLAVTPR
ncbi:MAG TPA: hypothetical protein VLA16_00815 [Ideonella sp.]|nr:hypothetical protein [Ideonella sp.]